MPVFWRIGAPLPPGKFGPKYPRVWPPAGVTPLMEPPDPLSNLLKSWRHEPPAAPRFNAEVWARIEAGRRAPDGGSFYRWALPLAASLAVLVGAASALMESRQQHAERMAATFVRSVDPFQMTGHHHQP